MSAEIISFDGARSRVAAPDRNPQRVEITRKRGVFPNEHNSRRALLRMFMLGSSFRQVARKHPDQEDGFAREIRAAIMGDGDAPPQKKAA